MTAVDYGIVLLLAASAVIGLFRGLVKEILSLIAYVAAFTGAVRYGPVAHAWMEPYIDTPALRLVVAYGAVFIVVLLLVGVLNTALGLLIRATGLSPADRGLGALFGLARGVVIVLALTIVAGLTTLPQEPWWKEAALAPLAEQGARTVKASMPEDWAAWIRY